MHYALKNSGVQMFKTFVYQSKKYNQLRVVIK